MKKLAVLLVVLLLALGATVTGVSREMTASADSGAATLSYIIFPAGTLPVLPPNIAMAENGDTIEVSGAGTITLHPKSATGGGSLVHRAPDGTIVGTGTWEATKLLSYKSFGPVTPEQIAELASLGIELPEGSEGGRALIAVRVIPDDPSLGEFEGTLTVVCHLGDKIPASAEEGVKLNVHDVLNFNKIVSGAMLFIRD